MIRRISAALAVCTVLVSLTACSDPAPAATHAAASASRAAPAITGVALDRIYAATECHQLVRKRVRAKPDQLVAFSHESTSGSAARMVAAGEASFSSTPAWSFRCTVALDGKGNVTSSSLSMGVL